LLIKLGSIRRQSSFSLCTISCLWHKPKIGPCGPPPLIQLFPSKPSFIHFEFHLFAFNYPVARARPPNFQRLFFFTSFLASPPCCVFLFRSPRTPLSTVFFLVTCRSLFFFWTWPCAFGLCLDDVFLLCSSLSGHQGFQPGVFWFSLILASCHFSGPHYYFTLTFCRTFFSPPLGTIHVLLVFFSG